MENEERKERIQWQPMIEMLIVLVTILGSTIPLYMHTDSKIDEHRKETNQILLGIQQEMKDFHGRLCAIEEKKK